MRVTQRLDRLESHMRRRRYERLGRVMAAEYGGDPVSEAQGLAETEAMFAELGAKVDDPLAVAQALSRQVGRPEPTSLTLEQVAEVVRVTRIYRRVLASPPRLERKA